MAVNNRYEALKQFIESGYEPLNNWIYFNAIEMQAGHTSINTNESPEAEQTFIDGTRDVSLNFSIAMIRYYDNTTSDTNTEAIAEADNFAEWLRVQNALRNFPDFGEGDSVYEMAALDSTPALSVDNERGLAKYQLNCVIRFLSKGAQ